MILRAVTSSCYSSLCFFLGFRHPGCLSELLLQGWPDEKYADAWASRPGSPNGGLVRGNPLKFSGKSGLVKYDSMFCRSTCSKKSKRSFCN